ncbi:MAG: PglZ domain-containing protein [Pseudomonas capeferrum]|jgi:hypothetical protein|uniref:PglZ domain-containing protein n=1 Tax=Pseudomonas capeferrum TaxID=1495066 RepID=UPI003D09A8C0
MSIQTFIQQEVLALRLSKRGVLVVYDPERRYRETCLALSDERCEVVDASESSILSREQASKSLVALGKGQLDKLLVYVPVTQPLTEEAKQADPFAIYSACGEIFPSGDSDSFLSLCLKAKPDQSIAIRQIFEADPNPSFAVIDAVGGGLGWPNLRALLKVESSRDILFALLAPSALQEADLKNSDTWVGEVRDLLKNSIGLSLKTKGKTWSSIASELWRFVLFSEFVFDLPEQLPAALADIPRADSIARPVIEGLCDDLRNDRRTQSLYIDRAEEVEAELGLVDHCAQLVDLGQRDTFPFEERTFLIRAVAAVLGDDTDQVRRILEQHQRSVWTGKGESHGQWDLVRSALELMQSCEDLDRQLGDHTRNMEALLEFYVGSLREVDRLHREFEQAVSDFEWQDADGVMTPVKQQARKQYGKLAEKVQVVFTRHLQGSGWPLPGYLANADVFDRLVAPRLQQNGRKVAYLMIDALRYELGVALERQLAEDGVVELKTALAQLPSVTSVGMASLLPGAGQQLFLRNADQSIQPMLGDQVVNTVAQRMEVFKKRYGQRFAEGRLEDFVRDRVDFGADIDLLVLRAVEIDSHFENHPDTAPAEITNALKRIRMAVHKLTQRGFHEVVIATDHGFFMNNHAGAGDVCKKPSGNWLVVHDRCALGDGSADAIHLMISSEKMGIRGDFAKFAGPQTLAAYRSGLQYYHGGASLQECVVPVITMQLKAQEQPSLNKAAISIFYKNGAKRITTRVPVIDVAVDTADIFSTESDFEILLEAHNSKGEVVGEAKAGGAVNPATGTLTLKAGEKVQVTLKMQMEFEGKFKVKALNPKTNAIYSQIELETDYAV